MNVCISEMPDLFSLFNPQNQCLNLMNLQQRTNLLTLVLGILIIALSYTLYRSLTDPYKAVLEEQAIRNEVRHRMELVRDALVLFNSRKGDYPPTDGGLDSLVSFLKTDELMLEKADSLLAFLPPAVYSADTLILSPRSSQRFVYTLNDSLRPNIYLLEDPNSDDRIGDLERTTLLNAPNWN